MATTFGNTRWLEEGKPVSHGWTIFMVVAGTGISKNVVDQAMASAIMKDSKYRWSSDTGAFDSPEEQGRYLRRYLPKVLINSKEGVRLMQRVWHWLRGRYGFGSFVPLLYPLFCKASIYSRICHCLAREWVSKTAHVAQPIREEIHRIQSD